MKKLCSLIVLVVLTVIAALAFAADPAAVATAVAVPVAEPSLFAWLSVNKAAIFAACLALSELLSLIPAFKGNGILDTVIKALQTLSGKEQTT